MSRVPSALVLSTAMRINRRLEASYAAYLADCEEDRQQGYRPHFCQHGMNLWTDFDPICGYCEDGFTMADGVVRRTYALSEARAAVAEFEALMDACEVLRKYRIGVSAEDKGRAIADMLAYDLPDTNV